MASHAYAHYRGRSAGRLMHFLYSLSSLFDHAMIGDGQITVGSGTVIGYYEWIFDTDIPVIHFVHPQYTCYNEYEKANREDCTKDEASYSVHDELVKKHQTDCERRNKTFGEVCGAQTFEQFMAANAEYELKRRIKIIAIRKEWPILAAMPDYALYSEYDSWQRDVEYEGCKSTFIDYVNAKREAFKQPVYA